MKSKVEMLDALGMQLGDHGCTVERDGDRALITLPESASSWVLLRAGDWLQVASAVLTEDELGEESDRSALNEFVMRVHARYLGCRFGYDDDDSLVVMSDVYPENVGATHLLNVMTQMEAVVSALVPLLRAAVERGEVPLDSEVDRAFSGV